jgi:hypothetical protein
MAADPDAPHALLDRPAAAHFHDEVGAPAARGLADRADQAGVVL